jgi:hypothetical protein
LFESLIETIFEIADNQEQQRLVEVNFTSFPAHLLGSNRKWLSIQCVVHSGLSFFDLLWFVMYNFRGGTECAIANMACKIKALFPCSAVIC